jgi:hypothetical protein
VGAGCEIIDTSNVPLPITVRHVMSYLR